MLFAPIRRPGVTAGCVTCGSAELGPRGWGGGRAGRGCAVRVAPGSRRRHVAPLRRRGQVSAVPRRGHRGAGQSPAPGGGGRTALALCRPAGDGRAGAGEEAAGGSSSRPSVSAPRHFARREVALPRRVGAGSGSGMTLLAVILERSQVLPAPSAEELGWPGTVLPDPLVCAGRGRRTRPLFRVPRALPAVCPWLVSRSGAPQSSPSCRPGHSLAVALVMSRDKCEVLEWGRVTQPAPCLCRASRP